MSEESASAKSSVSADWFMRGALTRIGEAVDRITGRKWTPSSSIATSELIERLKRLLDSEKKEVDGKGFVVPHNIKLKMQWDKFSTDSEETIERVQNELLVAAADYINDNLYYTLAPLHLEIKSDYFTEGVKLYASFGAFDKEEAEAELNVTVPAFSLQEVGIVPVDTASPAAAELVARFTTAGKELERHIAISPGKQVSIGRMAGNDLVIDDPSISKTHASLSIAAAGKIKVADTASTNGTFVNDERIAYGKAVPVGADDKLKIGSVEVTLELIQPEPAVENEEEPSEIPAASEKTLQLSVKSSAPEAGGEPPPEETKDTEGSNGEDGVPPTDTEKDVVPATDTPKIVTGERTERMEVIPDLRPDEEEAASE